MSLWKAFVNGLGVLLDPFGATPPTKIRFPKRKKSSEQSFEDDWEAIQRDGQIVMGDFSRAAEKVTRLSPEKLRIPRKSD